jgi:hypothetical protein
MDNIDKELVATDTTEDSKDTDNSNLKDISATDGSFLSEVMKRA